MSMIERQPDGRVVLTARGEFELARSAGFDTYEEFLVWKEKFPKRYEKWYAELKKKAGA